MTSFFQGNLAGVYLHQRAAVDRVEHFFWRKQDLFFVTGLRTLKFIGSVYIHFYSS